jgi:hypothetical protein
MYSLYISVFGQNGRSLVASSEYPIMAYIASDNLVTFVDEPPAGTENSVSGYINREAIISIIIEHNEKE